MVVTEGLWRRRPTSSFETIATSMKDTFDQCLITLEALPSLEH